MSGQVRQDPGKCNSDSIPGNMAIGAIAGAEFQCKDLDRDALCDAAKRRQLK